MEGRNILTLCPAEMKRALQPYVNNLFGIVEIESIEKEKIDGGSTQCFVITLMGKTDDPTG